MRQIKGFFFLRIGNHMPCAGVAQDIADDVLAVAGDVVFLAGDRDIFSIFTAAFNRVSAILLLLRGHPGQ